MIIKLEKGEVPDKLFCHFSFKRPRGKNIGYFAAALYCEYEGKNLVTHVTHELELWENHQFVTAIQSYDHVLNQIYRWQTALLDANVKQVILVTDNGILADWILDPKKNKNYTALMNKANAPYRVGGHKEIIIGVGLAIREYEKAYKYCKEEYVIKEDERIIENSSIGVNMIDITSMNTMTIGQIEKLDINTPEIKGMGLMDKKVDTNYFENFK